MKKAVILLSGGIDSSTTLAIARSEGYECYTLTFDYSQMPKRWQMPWVQKGIL